MSPEFRKATPYDKCASSRGVHGTTAALTADLALKTNYDWTHP